MTTPAFRAVLADDERLMREQLRTRLAEAWPELQIVAEARNGLEAVALVAQHRPDVGVPGHPHARARRAWRRRARSRRWKSPTDELLPEIVFITAYDQYAVEAFEQGVADYVLKPAERERLALHGASASSQRLATQRRRPDDEPPWRAAAAACCTSCSAPAEPRARRARLQWIQASVGQEHPA
jgi:DNA-binding LytR/AlgR family response regulator